MAHAIEFRTLHKYACTNKKELKTSSKVMYYGRRYGFLGEIPRLLRNGYREILRIAHHCGNESCEFDSLNVHGGRHNEVVQK